MRRMGLRSIDVGDFEGWGRIIAKFPAAHKSARVALPNRDWSRDNRGPCNETKGGDPVSHCLSPRSPASMSWIAASPEVCAA